MEKYAGFCLDMKNTWWNGTLSRVNIFISVSVYGKPTDVCRLVLGPAWQEELCFSRISPSQIKEILRHYTHFNDMMTSSNGNIFRVTGPLCGGIHRRPVNSPHKGQWRGALMFSLIYVWINGWINNHEAGDLRRHRAHYDVIVMTW